MWSSLLYLHKGRGYLQILSWRRNFHLVSTAWCHGDSDGGRGDPLSQQEDSKAPATSGTNDAENLQEKSETAQRTSLEGAESEMAQSTCMSLEGAELEHLIEQFRLDRTVRRLSEEHLITGKKRYREFVKSFAEYLTSEETLPSNLRLRSTIMSILNGSAEKAALFPHFLSHAQSLQPLLGPKKMLLQTSHLSAPASWFPEARTKSRKIVYHAGPTNSGKTHKAMQHFMAAKSAIYCAPLRLLAHEIFHRSNEEGAGCDLLTGEESQFASEDSSKPASRLSCTVEMAFAANPQSFITYDVCVIDEIQMLADLERGGAWTRALLGLLAKEVHVCGHECAIGLVKRIAETAGDTVEVHHYKRLSPLVISDKTLKGSYGAIRPGDCVVTFSRKKIFEISQIIEKATKQSCAVVYGDLPPAVRVKQAETFNDPESHCNVMVATDAIGMGLNMNIGRIIFHTLKKFDGSKHRNITPAHARQVAGRAGRYGKKRSKGFVTTFQNEDFGLLQSLLKSDIAGTEKAGLSPTVEQIELFSAFIHRAKLHEVLALFCKLAELDGNYFLCDLSNQIDLAYELREVDLELQDVFRFTLAPVDLKKPRIVTAFVEFAKHFSEEEEVSLESLREYTRQIPRMAKTPHQLAELELNYELVNLYLWLGMRFPGTFVDREGARDLQDSIEECIDHSLKQGPSLRPAVRRQIKFSRKRRRYND